MILVAAALAAASPAAAPAPAPAPLAEAARAIAAGRTEQARQMIAAAVAAGATGEEIERLSADLAFITGDHARAHAGYSLLAAKRPDDSQLLERAGIAALRDGETERAAAFLERATALGTAGWRAWNALGVAADRRGDWSAADRCYGRARGLAPAEPGLLSNIGWSRLLRGDWAGAIEPLRLARSLDPASGRIAANLDMAEAAASHSLPARREGESAADWAARLNDAGIAALRQGDRARAIAAFSRAIEASDRWFARAANNLAMLEGSR